MSTQMASIGRYQILAELGRGPSGVVYRALEPTLGQNFAVRAIRLAGSGEPLERAAQRGRLIQEARLAARLHHPGIVAVYEVGEQGDLIYIAAEYVGAPTLEQVLASGQAPSPELILSVLHQAAAALDYAQENGLAHRNLTPANIFLAEGGAVKIADFGIATIVESQQDVRTGKALGTPDYLAPEQIQGDEVDGRTDQFALAAIAYEMLTGEKPFGAGAIAAVLGRIISDEPAPPHQINPALGWAVGLVLTRALSKISVGRYRTCTELVSALDSALDTRYGWQALPRAVRAAAAAPFAQPVIHAEVATRAGHRVTDPHVAGLTFLRQMFLVALAAIAVLGLIFFGMQRWVYPEETLPPKAAEPQTVHGGKPAPFSGRVSATPTAEAEISPSPEGNAAPQGQTQSAGTAPVTAMVSTPTPEGTPASQTGPQGQSARTSGASQYSDQALKLNTTPPGALAILDNDPHKSCKTPCELRVASGRHTISFSLQGYRQEMRIVEISGPKEVAVNLLRPMGTVRIESRPPGAQILIDNRMRPETTPASIDLPAGKYLLGLLRNGHRSNQFIKVEDGALVRFEVYLPN